MSHSPESLAETDTNDIGLPPVRPPSAGFIFQLFVIPGVIVFVLILVWLMLNWLPHMGSDPAAMIREMRQNKANSWQLAYNLSEALRQDERVRNDPKLAKELADFLNELLDRKLPAPPTPEDKRLGRDPRNEEIIRRGFLCKALGELDIADDALPVLIRAASTHADEDQLRVRLAALESLALLAEKARGKKPLDTKDLLPLLMAASENEDHKIVTRAAVALTAVGNEEAVSRLVEMLEEPHHVDVRYNTALGLARLGNSASLEMLEEMLDPQQEITGEPTEEARRFKRDVILLNALRATRQLAEKDRVTDLSSLEEAATLLLKTQSNEQIRMEARSALRELKQRKS